MLEFFFGFVVPLGMFLAGAYWGHHRNKASVTRFQRKRR